jgi:hypothetical protein
MVTAVMMEKIKIMIVIIAVLKNVTILIKKVVTMMISPMVQVAVVIIMIVW